MSQFRSKILAHYLFNHSATATSRDMELRQSAGQLFFHQLEPRFEAQVTQVEDEEIASMPSQAPVRCSSSFCSGNMQPFVTSSGRSFEMRRYWKTVTLHEPQDMDVFPVPEDECSSYLETTVELSTPCLGRVSAPLPFQQLFQDDHEETVATRSCLGEEPVQVCNPAGSHEQFAVSNSTEEMNFIKRKSLLVCNNR